MDSKSSEISRLLTENEELSRMRVSLEMRAVEVEEQRDRLERENAELSERAKAMEDRMKVKRKRPELAITVHCASWILIIV